MSHKSSLISTFSFLTSYVIWRDDFKHFSLPSNNTSPGRKKEEHLWQSEIHWKFCYQSTPASSPCAAGHFLTCWNCKSHPCVHSWECAQASIGLSNTWWSMVCCPPGTAGIALINICFTQDIFWARCLSGIIPSLQQVTWMYSLTLQTDHWL